MQSDHLYSSMAQIVGIVSLACGSLVLIAYGFYSCRRKLGQLREPILPSTEETDTTPLIPSNQTDTELESEAVTVPSTAEASVSVSTLVLEVESGPAQGLRLETKAVRPPWPVLTIGRVSSNTLALNDPEVSSKHALVAWNPRVARWQVVDKGSLNGSMVNAKPIGAQQSADASARQPGLPVSLSEGDVLTVGTTSRIKVTVHTQDTGSAKIPFGVAVVADPMAGRKGGKPLPMEDVPVYEWPLRGVEEFGIFCVFDGHAGRAAAENASRMMPHNLSSLLQEEDTRATVLREGNAADLLRAAFHRTEAMLPNEDEGCTATVLLVWRDDLGLLTAQAANVGDSHCVLSLSGQHMVLTEDHRLTGPVERARLEASGKALREGETRLCGMNIARVLGDKFMKSQDVGLSAEPFISQAVQLGDGFDAIAVIASDGLWDVVSTKRAIQIAEEAKGHVDVVDERGFHTSTELMAEALLNCARRGRTQDNTTVLTIDFQSSR